MRETVAVLVSVAVSSLVEPLLGAPTAAREARAGAPLAAAAAAGVGEVEILAAAAAAVAVELVEIAVVAPGTVASRSPMKLASAAAAEVAEAAELWAASVGDEDVVAPAAAAAVLVPAAPVLPFPPGMFFGKAIGMAFDDVWTGTASFALEADEEA